MHYPTTPDGRYFVVRGRLWRCSNPALDENTRQSLVVQLMAARSAVRAALKSGVDDQLRQARTRVDWAKNGLGERGPTWWGDGSPDYNRKMVKNTPYADWYMALPVQAKT